MGGERTPATDQPATRGPSDRTFECPYCDRPFAHEEWRDLHRGLEHEPYLDAAEREAYERAYDAEAAEVRLFRLKALAVLVLVYFGFLLLYAFTL